MHAACFSSPDTTKAAPAHANTRSQTCCNPRHCDLVSKSGCLLLPSRRDLPSYLLLLRRLLLRSTACQIKFNAAGREHQASCCASCKLRCPLLCISSHVLLECCALSAGDSWGLSQDGARAGDEQDKQGRTPLQNRRSVPAAHRTPSWCSRRPPPQPGSDGSLNTARTCPLL